jgi:phosphoglycolate phosphatase
VSGLIVFDFDNTLVHSKIDFAGIRRELLALLRAAGHPEAGGPELARESLARLSIGQIIEAGTSHDPAIHAEGWRIVLEYETAGMVAATVEEDAAITLQQLKELGYQLAVMTNNARPATIAALDLFNLHDSFDLVLTRDEVPMKPDPAGILHAMTTFETRPARTVMIGDSWMDGAAASKAAALFIGFRAHPSVLDERGVPYWATVEQLGELVPLLATPWPVLDGRA